MYHNVLQVFQDVLLFLTMFSELRNDRQLPIASKIVIMPQGSMITPQKSAMMPQGSSILLRK